MLRRYYSLVFLISSLLVFNIYVSPAQAEKGPGLETSSEQVLERVHLRINGQEVTPDVPPVIVDSRTLVPIRVVSEALGAQVEWRETTREVDVRLGDTQIRLQIANPLATVNGQEVRLDSPPRIIRDRTMVPLRFVAEATGMKVDWDGETRTVIVGRYTVEAVRYEEEDGIPELRVKVNGPAQYRVRSTNGVVTVHILNADLAPGTQQRLTPGGRFVDRVLIDNSSEVPGAVELNIMQRTHLQPIVSYADKTITVGFLADLTQLTWQWDGDDRVQVSVRTTYPVRYSAELDQEANRLVVDFPNTHSKLAPAYRVNLGAIQRITTGPGLLPGWSRLTIELSQSARVLRLPQYDYQAAQFIIAGQPPAGEEDDKREGKLVFIDPGHGGAEPGAIGVKGLKEKDVNLEISLKLREVLEKNGYRVGMSRTDDRTVKLHDRPDMANRSGADIFISIHNNSFTDPRDHGTEIWYYNDHPGSPRLARAVQKALKEGVGLRDRGVKNWEPFVVVRYTKMPAILVECAFLSNPDEAKLLADPAFQMRLAKAIYQGINEYFAEGGK